MTLIRDFAITFLNGLGDIKDGHISPKMAEVNSKGDENFVF